MFVHPHVLSEEQVVCFLVVDEFFVFFLQFIIKKWQKEMMMILVNNLVQHCSDDLWQANKTAKLIVKSQGKK